VPAEQNHIYMNFLNITKEKNSNSGRYKLSAQWFTYLILTLLLIIVRKLFSNGVIIFIMRVPYHFSIVGHLLGSDIDSVPIAGVGLQQQFD
jgi:hypothetical protein